MQNNSLKVIIDTNLWISFLISKNYAQLDEIIFSKKCVLVFSKELLEEFLEVIKRPKFRRFFNQEDTEMLIETVQEYAEFFVVESKAEICRDLKDNFLLSLSKDSKADFLITGDKDLLDLKQFESTKIITMTEFLEN
ncbi:MAG: putative toxin-antitoxin system toxin component, PIN family [Chryseobacterium sp. 39-10]|nr:putative toxin-antitoxin system toxin component, PIN family [Chryseobacterium sp.]OJV49169.1 MAG: putative toxin-antitoxin system toxin component, PIN family [Chryseobacterium sp. 39-10]